MCFKDLPSLLNLVSILLRVRLQLRYPDNPVGLQFTVEPGQGSIELCTACDHPQASLSFPTTPKLFAMGTSNKDLDHRSGAATLRHDAHLTQAAPIMRTLYITYSRFTCIQSNLDICMQIHTKKTFCFEYHATFVRSNTSLIYRSCLDLSDSRLNS